MTAAGDYFTRVLSPWVPGVRNPLPARIDGLGGEDRLAVDVGCGPGVLTCYLAQRFGRVVSIDRDTAMIEATAELVEGLRAQGAAFGKIELRHDEWAAVDDLGGAHLVCAVNSILETDPVLRRLMLRRLRSALAPDGVFLGVFPSMEAQVHLLELYAADLARQGLDGAAIARAVEEELLVAHRFDAYAGTFASRGEPPQKFVYELELAWELRDEGLEPLEVERLVYPWEVCREVDAGFFPGETELWDWFVRAERC